MKINQVIFHCKLLLYFIWAYIALDTYFKQVVVFRLGILLYRKISEKVKSSFIGFQNILHYLSTYFQSTDARALKIDLLEKTGMRSIGIRRFTTNTYMPILSDSSVCIEIFYSGFCLFYSFTTHKIKNIINLTWQEKHFY